MRGKLVQSHGATTGYKPRFDTLEARLVLNGDIVLQWNDVLLDAIRATGTSPPRASRIMAIVHAAVYDAVNAIDRQHAVYLVDALPHPNASMEAAAAAAAFTTLSTLLPTQQAAFNTAYANSLAGIPDGNSENDGVALGASVANQILALRSNDGSNQTPPPFLGSTAIGQWRPTPAGLAPGLLPFWGSVTPFAMDSGDQFRPDAPPAVSSVEYTADYNEVKDLGAVNSATRTADQTQIALFWANGAGTATPPGHWNVIAHIVAEAQGNTLPENARLFAMLNVAQADAAISCWETKYAYNYWRPVTAIREGDTDGNADTTGDGDWTPLINTPPFPTFTSGHSTFSGAAATVLAAFFGTDAIAFTAPSETAVAADRSFTCFSQAADESAVSRLYGGIHFTFDNNVGLDVGEQIGALVAGSQFVAANQVAVGLVGNQVRVIGTEGPDVITIRNRNGQYRVLANGALLGLYDVALVHSIVIDGRGANDNVMLTRGVGTASEIFGGAGNDAICGGSGRDVISGEGGNDVIFGNDGDDELKGGAGVDLLFGGLGNDRIRGGLGNDFLFGGLGLDDLDGEDGVDFEVQ
jgi:hypothetical protein